MRVAIVGQGPRGIHALGELLARWPAHLPLEVDCFDPRPPGVGAAYAPDQPHQLRLNVHPRIVHQPPQPPLVDWLRSRGVDPDGDVPRALVSGYFARAREMMLAELDPAVTVRLHPAAATGIERAGQSWRLRTDATSELSGEAAGEGLLADEVLLSTGHAPGHDGAMDPSNWETDQPTRLVPAVYPVQQHLSLDQVPPGSTVAVRGAALTFIDVALTLFEARPEQHWPARLLPLSRSGLLMNAKPAVGFALTPAAQQAVDELAARLTDDPGQAIAVVQLAAARLLELEGIGPDEARDQVSHTLRTGWEPDLPAHGRALAQLQRSIAVARGERAPGASPALGRAWSALYPTLVARLSHSHPQWESWQDFLAAAAVLERFSFGPPLPNAIRLAELCERGLVDTSWMEHGVRVTSRVENLPEGQLPPNVLVDGVLSPPGAKGARTPLVDALLAAGEVRLAPGQRGLDVTPQAQCLTRDGSPSTGLSAVGRLVEDVVIGHDTLGRQLHHEVPQWAARLADGARQDARQHHVHRQE